MTGRHFLWMLAIAMWFAWASIGTIALVGTQKTTSGQLLRFGGGLTVLFLGLMLIGWLALRSQ